MAQIVIEQHGKRELREFPRLFTVGRRPDCAVVVTSREIAAVQARIDRVGSQFLLTNLAKAGRVFVNGSAVDEKRIVESHDEIEIGDARITFMTNETLDSQKHTSSISLRCVCGAGLVVQSRYAGKVKHCPKCQAAFTVPTRKVETSVTTPLIHKMATAADAKAPPLNRVIESIAAIDASTCPVCQCSVLADDERTTCPACGLHHHLDCWNENHGCSAYGCSQVGILKQGPDIRILPVGLSESKPKIGTPAPLQDLLTSESRTPWEFALLGLSVLCFLIGTVTYGVPSFLAGMLIVMFVYSRKVQLNWVVMGLAGLTCVVGLVAGLVISLSVHSH